MLEYQAELTEAGILGVIGRVDPEFPNVGCRTSNPHCRGGCTPCSQAPSSPPVQADSGISKAGENPPSFSLPAQRHNLFPSSPYSSACHCSFLHRLGIENLQSHLAWTELDLARETVATGWLKSSFPHSVWSQSRHAATVLSPSRRWAQPSRGGKEWFCCFPAPWTVGKGGQGWRYGQKEGMCLNRKKGGGIFTCLGTLKSPWRDLCCSWIQMGDATMPLHLWIFPWSYRPGHR